VSGTEFAIWFLTPFSNLSLKCGDLLNDVPWSARISFWLAVNETKSLGLSAHPGNTGQEHDVRPGLARSASDSLHREQ
jgi:hypothetical protein